MRRLAIIFSVFALLLIAGLTATGLYIYRPWYFEAVSLIRIPRNSAGEIVNGEFTKLSVEEFDVFRTTQADLIKTSFVANAALRQPGIATLKWAKSKKEPADALADAIEIASPEKSEVISVSLRGPDEKEITSLVDAVVDAYIREIVHKERVTNVASLERLRVRKHRLEDEIVRRLSEILELEKLVASANKSFDIDLQKSRVETTNQTLVSLELEALQTDDSDAQASIKQRLSKVETALKNEKNKLAQLMSSQADATKLAELSTKRTEVEMKKQAIAKLMDEIALHEKRLDSVQGITVMHRAQITD